MSKRYCYSTIILSALFCATPSLADKPQPRFSANGYASDYAIGEMDLMIPISGDRLKHTYFNPAIAHGSDNQGYADLGLGHRWIHNCKTLLGVYLFGGYTRTEHHAHLWVANPGFEAMGKRWDARLNGYLSMGDRNYHYQDGYVETYQKNRNQLKTFRQYNNDVFHSGNGLDLKLGYQLLPHVPLRGYLGGYYFHAKAVNNIGGGALGLEYWLDDHIKSFAHYTYDNIHHSTAALGIGIELGGILYHRSDPCVEERLTDPVERYLADLKHGSGIPGQSKHYINGEPVLYNTVNNIAFFSQGGTGTIASNCTIEAPCGPDLLTLESAETLNGSLPGTSFYFNGGTYNYNDILLLKDGQSLHSRTLDYTQPASGTERTTLNMSIGLAGNNTLEHLIVNSSSFANVTISASKKGNQITGSQLNAGNNAAGPNVIGIAIISDGPLSADLTVKNSTIHAVNDQDTLNAYGVFFTNGASGPGSSLTMSDSEINATLSSSTATQNVYGIITEGTILPTTPYTLNLSKTKITTTHNGTSGKNGSIYLTFPNDTGTALNSHFTINSINGMVDDKFISGNSTAGITRTNVICILNGALSNCIN